MSTQSTQPASPQLAPSVTEARPYVPPRLSQKRSLEVVTLTSHQQGIGGSDGPGSGWIGNP